MKTIDAVTFANRTSVCPEIIAEVVLSGREHNLSYQQVERFVDDCSERVRFLYCNNQTWKRRLDSKTNRGRDMCYTFISHWLDAYLKAGERYYNR